MDQLVNKLKKQTSVIHDESKAYEFIRSHKGCHLLTMIIMSHKVPEMYERLLHTGSSKSIGSP